jgi:hypothetical protein
VVIGTGTSFQTYFCGGAGNTTPIAGQQIVLWYPVPGGGGATGVRGYNIASCDSQLQLTMSSYFSQLSGTVSGMSYSYVGCSSCWGGQSNNMNYYDVVLGYYSLYYRSGRTQYLTQARTLAQRWWSGLYLDQGRSWVSPLGGGQWQPIPRIAALAGVMWWAYETQQPNVWTSLYPALDMYVSYFQTVSGPGDTREDGDGFGALAIAARLAPDASRRSEYASAITTGLTGYWVPQLNPGGYYLYLPLPVSLRSRMALRSSLSPAYR